MNIKTLMFASALGGGVFLSLSCVRKFPPQFDSNNPRQTQVFSIEEVLKAKCRIKTGRALGKGVLESQAQELVIEPSQFSSVDFSSYTMDRGTPPVINNLPFVEYEVQGNELCLSLIHLTGVRLIAKPHFSYSARFQISGSHLRILMAGRPSDLPYQRLMDFVPYLKNYYSVPIGGYDVEQGSVEPMKNVENQETHIIDFFPNKNQPLKARVEDGISHAIREGSSALLISNLNKGFHRFEFKDKKNIFPKSYFEGVWHAGISVVSVNPIHSTNLNFLYSGMNLSADSHSGGTHGQTIYFQFEAGHLKAFNENYRKQAEELNLSAAAEAETLSLPVEHRDYRFADVGLTRGGGLKEEARSDIPWQEKRYVEVDFSKIDHYFSRRVKAIAERYKIYPYYLYLNTDSLTVNEIRFADDYFDFVVYDGHASYRFAFRRKKQSNYRPFSVSKADKRFEYFYSKDRRIFKDPTESFQTDARENSLVMRVQPDPKGQIVLHFSNLTPKDAKVRSIGLEAVSLWNQVLSKAELPITLVLDQSTDAAIGDNRRHILNMPLDKASGLSGVAQMYVDDETGEVISSGSNTVLNQIIEVLKSAVIQSSYKSYGLLDFQNHPRFFGIDEKESQAGGGALSYSPFSFSYLSFENKKHFMLDGPFLQGSSVDSADELESYLQKLKTFKESFLGRGFYDMFSSKASLMENQGQWVDNFKFLYALKTGRFVEEDGWKKAMSLAKEWKSSRWDQLKSVDVSADGHFHHIVSSVCHFIPHPLNQRSLFKKSVNDCVEKIYPIYALGTTVHEIGHAVFSLRHNFAGSSDKKNFPKPGDYTLSYLSSFLSYKDQSGAVKNLQEEFPAIASTVMDYGSLTDGEQWAPGPYDVSAIRLLYEDMFPEKSFSPLLDREFLQCSDERVHDSTYCLRYDMGSSPEEIARREAVHLVRFIKDYFYSFDRELNTNYNYKIFFRLNRLMTIYYDWRNRLRDYAMALLKTPPEEMNDFEWKVMIKKIITEGQSPEASPSAQELLSFYRARNVIYHTLTYIAFLPNRYCVLRKNFADFQKEKHSRYNVNVLLELSKVNEELWNSADQKTGPLVSCFEDQEKTKPHPIVSQYIEKHLSDYELEGEEGWFIFPDRLRGSYTQLSSSARYQGSFTARLAALGALTVSSAFFPRSKFFQNQHPLFTTMMNENDIKKAIERLILARTSKGVFYSKKDFFLSLEETALENLTPEESARILFKFPPVEDRTDILFRDEFIEPKKLNSQKADSYQRSDRHEVQFYSNFSEELKLIFAFNSMYAFGNFTSGGVFIDSLSRVSNDVFKNLGVMRNLTSLLLGLKESYFGQYMVDPELSSSNYFEISNLVLLPQTGFAHNLAGRVLLKELAYNLVRSLWSSNYSQLFWGLKSKINGAVYHQYGFSYRLLFYLQRLIKEGQGNRLGRFYFIYAYVLSLALLDSYETLLDKYDGLKNTDHLFEKATAPIYGFKQIVEQLFSSKRCEGNPLQLLNTYNFVKSTNTIPEMNQESGQIEAKEISYRDKQKLKDKIQDMLSELCSESMNGIRRGKMLTLFNNQESILNHQNSFMKIPMLSEEKINSVLGEIHLPNQEMLLNQQSRIGAETAHFGLGPRGVEHISEVIFTIFFKYFLKIEDKKTVKEIIRAHRQILIDVIPKMMMMYSQDRNFIREMMLIMSRVYRACFYSNVPDIACRLQVERVIGYYFRRSVYFADEEIEKTVSKVASNGWGIEKDGIPLEKLVNLNPQNFLDSFVVYTPLDEDVLSDYVFYERGWEKLHLLPYEGQAQKELIFSLFPVTNLRAVDSSLVFKYYQLME